MAEKTRKARRGKINLKSMLSVLAILACVILLAYFVSRHVAQKEPSKPLEEESSIPLVECEWHVFLAGTNGYPKEIPSLESAERDVEELQKLFKNLGVKDENIIVLKTENSDVYETTTKESLELKYEEFLNGLTKNSIAFVFLSGHGFSEGEKSYYAPRDFKLDKTEKKISIDDWLKKLSKTKARFKWMCIDACRTPIPDRTRDLNSSILTIGGVPKDVLLTQSCEQGQYSYETTEEVEPVEKKRHSLFTRAFIEAIDSRSQQADTNGDGVSLNELRDYLERRVPLYVDKYYPGSRQDPEFTGIENWGELGDSPLFEKQYVSAWKLLAEAEELIVQYDSEMDEGRIEGARGVIEEASAKLNMARSFLPEDDARIETVKNAISERNGQVAPADEADGSSER